MGTPEQKVVDILKNNRIDIATTLPCDRIKALLVKKMASGFAQALILAVGVRSWSYRAPASGT
jgi:sulfopyruvate decarboxylase TPP-binding subunit